MTRHLDNPDNTAALDTRERLIHAAAELFAEQGYHDTSVREICAAAEANVAAVNYHFGDKLNLYRAAFDYADDSQPIDLPPPDGDTGTAETRLHQYVASHIALIVLEGRDSLLSRLMSQELMHPSALIPHIAEKTVRPRAEILRSIIADLLGDDADEDLLRHIHLSIVGQCVFYHKKEPFLAQVYPSLVMDEAFAEALTDHITRFSLAGIAAARALTQEGHT